MSDAIPLRRTRHPRHCPRCSYPLTGIEYQGAEIDHCHRCGGTLVEPGNIKLHYGKWANPRQWIDDLGRPSSAERLPCPADGGTMTGYQVRFDGRSVAVDHCEICGSLWLDKGEGQKLSQIVRAWKLRGDSLESAHGLPGDAHAENLARAQDLVEPQGVQSYLFQLFTGMPVEVWNPVRGSAPAMKMLFASLIAVFAIQLYFLFGATPEAAERFIDIWALTPEAVLSGERPWGLVTHMFLHGGIFHIFANCYMLWIFGDNVEDRIGTNRFVALYLGAGLGAGLLQTVLQADPSTAVVGASGAIAGLMGAYVVLFPRVKLWVLFFFVRWRVPAWVYLGLWFLLQLVMGYGHVEGIAWFAHIGGFVVGLACGWAFRKVPHPLADDERRVMGVI